MQQKFFPIKTDTACQLKWTWSTIQLFNGETKSCHRVNSGFIDPDNFANFHNTPKKIQDRQIMLQGQWPVGECNYCQNMESIDGHSDRQFHLQIPNLSPPELDNDPTALHVTPRILEVYLDNTCNMACIYCNNKFSSRIHHENQKFGRFDTNNVVIDNTYSQTPYRDKLQAEFWVWLENNYHLLRRLHVLGGEPFYQSQFDMLLQFLETHNNPELEFNIVTNLKVPQYKLQKTFDRLRILVDNSQIKRVDVTCSIDCWGPEQEYIRHGIDIAQWRTAFEYLVDQSWIYLNINQTITALGIKSMPDLLSFVNRHRKKRPIQHYHMAVARRPWLHPTIFDPRLFDKDFDKILEIMPNNTWDDVHSRNQMITLKKQCEQSSQNLFELSRLKTFLNEIDRRRNLDWQTVFPWLTKELYHVV